MRLQKRPHFNLRHGQLYFLNSKKSLPPLSANALELLTILDVENDLAPLTERLGPMTNQSVAELCDRGICDLIIPVKNANRHKVLVLEPHCDDAALSIGSCMWQLRNTHEFTVITLAGRSNFSSSFHTNRVFFDRETVSRLRDQEGSIYMQHLGGHYRALPLLEATLRYSNTDWNQDFFKANRASVAANSNRKAPQEVLDCWIRTLKEVLALDTSDELWIPLGAGTHSDHDLTRNAALSLLMSDPSLLQRYDVRIYMDVPYGVDCPEHTLSLLKALRNSGAVIEPSHQPILGTMDKKIDLLRIFASQFKIKHIAQGVKKSAIFQIESNQPVEHMWRLSTVPTQLNFDDLFIKFRAANNLAESVTHWLKDRTSSRRLNVLLLNASGRWKLDERTLRDQFPKARIVVYATPATIDEVQRNKSEDVTLVEVSQGPRAWLGLALKMMLLPRSHILFVSGRRHAQASILKTLWPFSRSLVVEDFELLTMNLSKPNG